VLVRLRRGLAAAVVALAVSVPAGAETLADALIAAYRNSNLLEQNRAVLRAADEDVAAAVSALRPVLAFEATATRALSETRAPNPLRPRRERITETASTQTTLALVAQLTLYDFGRSALAIEAAKESVLATREALVNVEQQVLLNAVAAYVGVRLNGEIVALREANVRLITRELQAAQDRFDLGEITRTDVALAEARLAQARSQLIGAQGDLMVAREDFRLAVGRYPGTLAALPAAPRTARSLDEARGVAERTHPLVRQAQRLVTVAELNVGRAKAGMRPTVSAQGRVSRTNGEDTLTDSATVGLTIDQTLYAGGRLSAVYRQAVAGRDQSRATLLQQTAVIGQAVGAAWANLVSATAGIEATEREIAAAQIAFDGVREEASLGARTTLDVLDAEQDLLQARVNRITAEASRYLGVYQLLSAMGLLTVEHLGLGIPTYDPAAYYNAVKTAPVTSTRGKALDRVLKSIGRDGGN
jgi:outer membrane protein